MNNEPLKILLVEVTPGEASLQREALPQSGTVQFEIVRVAQFKEALQYLDQGDITVFLLGLLPSEMSLKLAQAPEKQLVAVPMTLLIDPEIDLQTVERAVHDLQTYFDKEQIEWNLLTRFTHCAIDCRQLQSEIRQYCQQWQVSEARFRNVIARNADGILIVDHDGIVRFMNPAAETILNSRNQDLLGELFGFPVIAGETTELDIVRQPGPDQMAEMRVVDIEWEGVLAYLISLRDITEQKKIERALRETEAFSRAILNSIMVYIAVVNEEGLIITTNEVKDHYFPQKAACFFRDLATGVNYFTLCRQAGATQLLNGMLEVLRGETDSFEAEFPCHTPDEEFWFLIRAKPFEGNLKRSIVVSHIDITKDKRAAQAEAESRAKVAWIDQREREIRSLLELAHPPQAAVTASIFGLVPLRESVPSTFEEIVQRYNELIDLALEQRAFKIDHRVSEHLRAMANQLGFLKAGPRDLIDIHSTVLERKGGSTHPLKAQAYVEEGRLMVLELMGYLVSYYRSFSIGVRRTLTPEALPAKPSNRPGEGGRS